MTLVKNKLAVAVAIALSTSFGLVGCGDDKSVSTAVGVPNPNALMPTGTVQGVLRDSVTNEPIVGAIVDIGIAQAVTSETGQFVIVNVPATKATGAVNAGGNDPYRVTIDLRNVKQAAGAAKYPSFSFATAEVTYSSLNDGSNDAGTSSSNHDTPVTGLTAPLTLTVGKLAAGIKGTVVKETDLKAVGAGYIVKLVSVSNAQTTTSSISIPNPNSTTGAAGAAGDTEKVLDGNVVATTTTDAAGAFAFSGIESLHDFRIEVINADGTEYGREKVKSPADGQVKTLLAQRVDDENGYDLRTVFVKSTDTLAPRVVKSTPETGTERAPGANVTVTFSFSEPIVSNGLTNSLTASTAGNGGLYDLVDVQFKGIKDIAMKAGNIPYSLAWDESRTQLTVIIPSVKASAKYEVSIVGAKDILVDNQGSKTDFAFVGSTSANAGVVKFSTSAEGAAKPEAVSRLAITNNADLNDKNNAVIDWLPVAGAKGYHVYRAEFVNDVMTKDYRPIERTPEDAAAAIALENAKTAVGLAKGDVTTAKTNAGIAAQVYVNETQKANVADATANQDVKAVDQPINTMVSSTASSAGLTATAETSSRTANKSALAASESYTENLVSAVGAISTSFVTTDGNVATANNAKNKVITLQDVVADAEIKINTAKSKAAAANTVLFTAHANAKMAAAAAATLDEVVKNATALTAISAAATHVATAKVEAAQAAYNANKNQATEYALAVANDNLANAKKQVTEAAAEAKKAAEAADGKYQEARILKDQLDGAVGKAKTDSAIAAGNVTKAQQKETSAKSTLDGLTNPINGTSTLAQKAVSDAQKAVSDAQTELNDAKNAAEKADAVADLQNALSLLATAKQKAGKYAQAVKDAEAAVDAAAALKVAADAAKDDVEAAGRAILAAQGEAATALSAIQTAVNAADAAADSAVNFAELLGKANITSDVLNAQPQQTWRAKVASAMAKLAAVKSVSAVSKAGVAEVVKAAEDAAKAAKEAETAAKGIATQATAAKMAVNATKTLANKVFADAKTAHDAADNALNNATTGAKATAATKKTARNTALTKATAAAGTVGSADDVVTKATAAKNAAIANMSVFALANAAESKANSAKLNLIHAEAWISFVDGLANPADADFINANNAVKDAQTAAGDTVTAAEKTVEEAQNGLNAANALPAADPNKAAAILAATALKAAADAALQAAKDYKTTADDLVKAQPAHLQAQRALAAAIELEFDTNEKLIAAKEASDAADEAFNKAGLAETAANTFSAKATTARQEADVVLTNVKAAKTPLEATVDAVAAAKTAAEKAQESSKKAAEAADAAATAGKSKQQADKALADALKEQATADKALADAQGVVDSNSGFNDPEKLNDKPVDKYLTLNTSFVEDGSAKFVDGIRKITYKYKVRAVSENNVESVDSDEVEAKDNTAPKVASFTMNTASNVITVVFTEPMNELDFRNEANYVLSAPTGVTLPESSSKMFKIDNKTVVLTYKANIPAGSTVTVKGVKDLAGNTMSEVGNSATVDKVTSSIAGFVGSTQVTVFFSANMDKVSAETAANYVLSSGPALLAENGVVYDAGNNSVTLTYVSAIPAGARLTVSGVKDANGTVVDSNFRDFN